MRLHPTPSTAGDVTAGEEPQPAPHRSPWRRRLLIGGTLIVLLLLLVLTPPLVNANRYRSRIADTMSASLGRPVHLDSVSFHMLPAPGFTLSNLVVSEDPAFGAEPTIRADSVEASLRVSSLWHRPVEFSTVRFINPSVNLVRNADGRWNLADVLLHASRVDSAPTVQRHVGPTPRFPYIEATAGRVNLKLGLEKTPFSLTDADFALWLPSPQRWRVRLVGHPARTDIDINDPGTLRLEGELHRADIATAVPVNFRASWHDVPLGQASRILTGDDQGWRGTLNLDATLAGTLGDARLGTKLTLGDLRRAEFFPTHPLDLQMQCAAGLQLRPAALSGLQCTLPDDAPEPLTLAAAQVDLQHPAQATMRLKAEAVPTRWALLWAALFSPRIPTDLPSAGTLALDVSRGSSLPPPPSPARKRSASSARNPVRPTAPAQFPGWNGTLTFTMPPPAASAPAGAPPAEGSTGTVLTWNVVPAPDSHWPLLTLPPSAVRLGPGGAATLTAIVTATGYTFTLNGTASPAALLLPAHLLPPLGDGLEGVLPAAPVPTDPLHLTLHCEKEWLTPQVCSDGQATTAASPASPPPA